MGVADKRTYKNEYHFTDDSRPTSEQHPSIEKDPKVNTSIKENPYRSNVEIEGGEIVLQPDLSALFKAKGKRHSQGGMDVLLKPDSFVFSDFKELEIDEDEAEDFELKEGGTPAKTLKKNIDIKHYNMLVQNISNPYKDDLAKKSSAKMLEKYIKMLGNIAYIQENKKGFPQGLPDFSIGAAPMENEELEDQIDENKQYMKAGGITKNPYKAQSGVNITDDIFNAAKKKKLDNIQGWTFIGERDGAKIYQKTTTGEMKIVPAPTKIARANMSNDDYLKMLSTNSKFAQYSGEDLASTGRIDKSFIDIWNTKYRKLPNTVDYGYMQDATGRFPAGWYNDKTGPHYRIPDSMREELKQEQPTGPVVEQQDYTPQGVKRADWKFTPWQKLSQAYNWGQVAGVQRYMPFRSRYNATYVDPALVNPEQVIGDIKGLSSQQLAQLNTLSPILRNAQAAQLFGSVQSQIPGIRSQYDNQNAQILNQTRMYNNQVKNNESMVNMANDQQYYTQAVEGRKNFENERQFLANQAMNNVMRDVETNQKLAYNLLTQNNPAYEYDWNTGNFTRTNKSIMDVASAGENNYLAELLDELKSRPNSDPNKYRDIIQLLKIKEISPYLKQQSSFNPFAKKGGRVKNPYKK